MSNLPSYASKLTCEPDKIIIEVSGLAHDDSQFIAFYDNVKDAEETALTQRLEKHPREDNVLHKWLPDSKGKEYEAQLHIATEQGEPIKLPLFKGQRTNPQKLDE